MKNNNLYSKNTKIAFIKTVVIAVILLVVNKSSAQVFQNTKVPKNAIWLEAGGGISKVINNDLFIVTSGSLNHIVNRQYFKLMANAGVNLKVASKDTANLNFKRYYSLNLMTGKAFPVGKKGVFLATAGLGFVKMDQDKYTANIPIELSLLFPNNIRIIGLTLFSNLNTLFIDGGVKLKIGVGDLPNSYNAKQVNTKSLKDKNLIKVGFNKLTLAYERSIMPKQSVMGSFAVDLKNVINGFGWYNTLTYRYYFLSNKDKQLSGIYVSPGFLYSNTVSNFQRKQKLGSTLEIGSQGNLRGQRIHLDAFFGIAYNYYQINSTDSKIGGTANIMLGYSF